MRLSRAFFPTAKENPADAEITSHRLMIRAGLMRKLASGLYSWLPMGLRVMRKIEVILREELNHVGAEEMLMPVVQPAELWQESGRWDRLGPELARLQDRHSRSFCLGPTHEEVITDILRQELVSYRQLPFNLYQIQLKFRDEIRPRFGVLRAREFIMMDAYSFHDNQESFDDTYRKMYDCFARVLKRVGVDFAVVMADPGNIGGENSHEFHVIANAGEDVIAIGDMGRYAANLERAECALPTVSPPSPREPLDMVPTPGLHTIDEVRGLLGVDVKRTVKTLVFRGRDTAMVALVLRGDHHLNEVKAARLDELAVPLEWIGEDELHETLGAGPGSIGPRNLAIPFLVDRSAALCHDFVCGANIPDRHFTGVNWGRDVELPPDGIVDLRNVAEGDLSPDGKERLRLMRGIEAGHIFQLDTKYSAPMQANVQCEDGTLQAMIMGCYGMGVSRLVGAIIEQHHDDRGIRWPQSVAPFFVMMVPIARHQGATVNAVAERLYTQFGEAGIEVLLDDREQRPGVKFAESELLGIPWRLIISERGLEDGKLELHARASGETFYISVEGALEEFVALTGKRNS